MQACILRAKHPDKEFCWNQWGLLRSFLVHWRDHAALQSSDEKKAVPVGNAGNLVQAVEKTCKVMTQVDGRWVSLDHGWSMNNIVPSAVLQIDIPESVDGSWYEGTLVVFNKDKTFGNEDAASRHTVEGAIARQFCLGEQRREDAERQTAQAWRAFQGPAIIAQIHDGAADYNMLNGGALLAHLVDYFSSGADLVISFRFCPYQSYLDPVEHCMSLLNLGLQAVALARDMMPPELERELKGCSSMKDVRKKALMKPQIRAAVLAAMEAPIQLVNSRFDQLEWTENPVTCLPPATEEELEDAWELLLAIDETIKKGGTAAAVLSSKENLQEFLSTHTQQRTYMVQTLKT